MRTLFFASSAALVTALTIGCGDGSANPTGTGMGTGAGGTGTTGSTGGGGNGGNGGSAGHGGDGGNGGAGGAALADPLNGNWRDGFGVPGLGGFAGRASSIVRGPDGHIYVGGIFSDAGGVPAQNVAVWDGVKWQALGAGLPNMVNALAIGPDGALYAGGLFSSAADPTNHLARWDGTAWTMLPGEVLGQIRALATQGDHLLVAAASGDIAGLGTAGIASYHPTNGWSAIDGAGADFDVDTILVTGDSTFCIGGLFGSVDGTTAGGVACWDGAAWSQLGDGLPGGVSRLAKGPDGTFYAGGTFTYILDYNTGAYSCGIASLNGSTWTPFHGGIDNGDINEVRAIAFAPDGDLLIGGTFNTADSATPVPAHYFARWDFQGNAWSEVGGGVRNDVGLSIGAVTGVNDLLVLDDGTIWVGGLYSSVNGGTLQTANVATVKGDTWSPVIAAGTHDDAVAGLINDMAVDAQGRVVAGGYFTSAGGVAAVNVGRYGTNGWEALGTGVDNTVRAVIVQKDGSIVVGGEFTHAGGVAAPFIARWDGTAWSKMGQGFDGPVTTLAADAQGALYAGGDFTNHVARWDGTVWKAVGNGLDNRVTAITFDRAGRLIVTGLFQNSGSTVLHGLAAWDSSGWQAFGDGFGNFEYGSSIAATKDGFVVAGAFTSIDGNSIAGLARWDGKTWSGFGAGLPGPGGGSAIVTAVTTYGDNGLFATGTFDMAGGASASHVAYWDGTSWHALGAGLDDLAERLVVSGDTLWVGGSFLQAGGKISTGIAAWDFAP